MAEYPPNTVIRACIAMAYPPRKFAPGRDRQAGQPRRTMDRDLAGLGIGAHDPSEVFLEDMPPGRKRWRNSRIVHFDIDIGNSKLLVSRMHTHRERRPHAPAYLSIYIRCNADGVHASQFS